MKSDPAIGGGARQKTGAWHPGTADRKRGTRQKSRPPSSVSSGKSGFPAKAGYWGHVNSSGEFERASQFPTSPAPPFSFPWAALWAVMRGVAPTAVAAFVGAVTALTWQSYVAAPDVPSHAAPIVQPVAPPVAALAPAPARAPVLSAAPLAGSPPPQAASPPAVEYPTRTPALARQTNPRRPAVTPRIAPAPRRKAVARPASLRLDEDGILEPTF